MVCVDTSFVIALECQEQNALEKVQELGNMGVINTTSITVVEVYRGAYISKSKEKTLKNTRELLGLFAIPNLDYEAARILGDLANTIKSDTVGDRDLYCKHCSCQQTDTCHKKQKTL